MWYILETTFIKVTGLLSFLPHGVLQLQNYYFSSLFFVFFMLVHMMALSGSSANPKEIFEKMQM